MVYKIKPIEVDAFRLGIDYIPDWFMDGMIHNEIILRSASRYDISAEIETLFGVIYVSHGDYVIRGINGEIAACKADTFEMIFKKTDK